MVKSSSSQILLGIGIGLGIWTCWSCAPSAIPHSAVSQSSSTRTNSSGYETLARISARDLYPLQLLAGKGYRIRDEIEPVGLTYIFTIDSPFGEFTAHGEDMLRIRIRELRALAVLQHKSAPAAFGSELAKTAIRPVTFLWRLLTHPADTMAEISHGLRRTTDRIQEMAVGERSSFEDSQTQELLGFSRIKRHLAAQLGVDVYSSNPILQQELDRLAWAAYAGGLGVKLLAVPLSGPVGLALMSTTLSADIHTLLVERTPEDLQRLNRAALQRIGIADDLIQRFLSHPWYSPRHKTIIVQALANLVDVRRRSALLQVALLAQREEDALFVQHVAEMLVSYHTSVVPLEELLLLKNWILVGHTTDQALVALVPLARLLWTAKVEEAALAMVAARDAAPHRIRRVELWLTGRLSDRARSQLETLGFMVYEGVLTRMMSHEKIQDDTLAFLMPAR
ncbi:MAG: hypothetical protein D6704_04980 [Nitrospirae bacterium]|nr:MAG: hypothetical protein D6704_04980 [Nitrospirota bacterium]